MAKPKRRYICQACGSVTTRWQGQCADCGLVAGGGQLHCHVHRTVDPRAEALRLWREKRVQPDALAKRDGD